MKRYFSVLCFCLIGHFMFGQTPAISTTQVNNVRATFKSDGTLFSDGQQGQFVPIEAGLAPKTLLRSSGIWLAGTDAAGNLKGATQFRDKTDFMPGGLSTDGSEVNQLTKIWKVSCEDLQQHLSDYQDNGVIDHPNAQVYGYPGRSNPYFEQYNQISLPTHTTFGGLASFWDRDLDEVYDPSQGDYPWVKLRGWQAVNSIINENNYFAFNSLSSSKASGMIPLKAQVQTQLFAFNPTTNSILNNTVLVRYQIYYRGAEPVDSCYFGVYADFEIGNAADDFMGCIPEHNIFYAYNGDNNDEGGFSTEIPVMAVQLLRGPLDVNGDEVDLNSMVAISRKLDSLDAFQQYSLLSGSTQNVQPGLNAKFMYPGNPNNPNEISEISLGNTPGHRIGVASYGPIKLLPGTINELIVSYTYVHKPGATPLQNVQALHEQAIVLREMIDWDFPNVATTCKEPVDAPHYIQETGLLLSPNPADADFTIESKGEPFNRIEVVDMLGRRVKSIETMSTKQLAIQTDDLQSGVYQVRVGGRVLPVVVQH